MKKFGSFGWNRRTLILGTMSLLVPVLVYGASQIQPSCEDKLRQASIMLEITRNGRDRAEIALSDLYGHYQDALKQIDELKSKLPRDVQEAK